MVFGGGVMRRETPPHDVMSQFHAFQVIIIIFYFFFFFCELTVCLTTRYDYCIYNKSF